MTETTSKQRNIVELAKDLPEQPKAAIYLFASRVSRRFFDQRGGENLIKDSVVDSELAAVRLFYARFFSKFGIQLDDDVVEPEFDDKEFVESVTFFIVSNKSKFTSPEIETEIDELIDGIAAKGGDTFGVAHLNEQEKIKIHSHIEKIRRLVSESDLSERKKNALFERLNALSLEVDQYGTRTDRFFAFMGDAAFCLGDMTKKAAPFIEEVKNVIKIVSRARARQEGVSLPPGDEPLSIPAPEEGLD
jgi:hypothetical protein